MTWWQRSIFGALVTATACRGDYDDGPAEEESSTAASDSSTDDSSSSTSGTETGTGDADGSSTDSETTDDDTTDSDESTTDTETDAGMETGDTTTTGPMCAPKGGNCDFDGDCCADLCFGGKCGCAGPGQECGGDELNCCAAQCIYDINQAKSCCGGC